MKKVLFLTLILAAAALPAFSQSLYKGVVRIDNCTMYEDGDSLRVYFTAHIDREAARWAEGTLLTPVLADGKTLTALPEIMLLGKNKNRAYLRSIRVLSREKRDQLKRPDAELVVSPETDARIEYTYAMPYDMWMDNARLAFYLESFGFRNERTLVAIAAPGGVNLTARAPYEVQPQVDFLLPEREAKSRKKQGSAFLDFQVGKSVIIPTYRRNPEELAKIRDAFGEVSSDENATITGLFIEGYASVEGDAAKNQKLSGDRAQALRNYIMSNFQLPLRDDQIRVSAVGEDWEGLRTLVEESELAQKEQILAIIDNTPVANGREAALMRLAGGTPYRTMMRDMFPLARRVEYQIDYAVKDFSLDESRALLTKNPGSLSQLELYNLAQNYGPGTEEYRNIMLEIIPRYFPEDVTATVNTAAVMILGGEHATAKRLLERFADNPQVWNNLGALEMAQGNLEAAETLLKKAEAAGVPEAQANLIELTKKREDNVRMERYKNR